MPEATCSIDGCEKPVVVKSRGWCTTHYQRWKKYGDANATVRLWRVPLADRLLARCEVSPDGCWLWTGARQKDGYGIIGHERKCLLAHRAAYVTWVGPIPEELEIDHLCRVRRCIRPDHLAAVTHLENVRRAVWVPKTHCPQGHEYTPENTYWSKVGTYTCVTCRRARGRIYDRQRRSRKRSRS